MRSHGSGYSRTVLFLAVFLSLAGSGALRAQEQDESIEPLFNWDLVSLEQNNQRFNGSALTGFHSIRSAGVTPLGGWKMGLGFLYTGEEQFDRSRGDSNPLFRRNELYLNPKLNMGLFENIEFGAGLVAAYANGRAMLNGEPPTVDREEGALSSADLGVKWKFYDDRQLRFALSFDTRLSLNEDTFGMLKGNYYNVELDGDYAVTSRLSMAGNLQFLTSDSAELKNQFILDVAAVYSFTNTFRGMLFSTIQEDDLARTFLGFIGFAGQYVYKQHAFTLSFDIQLNDADREIRTEEQIDIALSYTYAF
ncbi:MAG: hypothetical protein OSB83_09850 [Planctomycetota bacterium]|nr:hypothetical protein [Planctomycetota bacterium]